MATLTIRNLPEDVRDQLRREAAEHRRSMEEEARQALAERYRNRLSPHDVIKKLDRLNVKQSSRCHAILPAGDSLIAGRRLEAAYDEGRISWAEKAMWDERLAQADTSLANVVRFIAGKRTWRARKS